MKPALKPSIRRTRHPLPRGEAEVWAPFSARYGISPYACKYLHTAGVLREFAAGAGSLADQGHQLAAAHLALNGAELVGRCVSERTEQGVTQRLRNGLAYLEGCEPPAEERPVPEIDALVKLRGFTAHPTLEPPADSVHEFAHATLEYLLDRLTLATDRLWTGADPSTIRTFAAAKITPMRPDGRSHYIEALLPHPEADPEATRRPRAAIAGR